MNLLFRNERLIRLSLIIACVSSISVFVFYTLHWMPKVTHGFTAYYTYARMIFEGEDLSKAYDYHYFNEKVRSYGIDVLDMPNNIPTNALTFIPVAWLSPVHAKIVWTIISLIAFILSLRILFKLYGITFTENLGLGLLALIFLWRPIYDCIALGQIYFFLLFLFAVSIWGITKQRIFFIAIPISFVFLFKGYALVTIFWFLVNRQWKEFLMITFCLVFIIVMCFPIIDTNDWVTFYKTVVDSLGRLPIHAHVAFQTLNGFIHHLFTYDKQWLPAPLIELPKTVVTILSYGFNILLIVVILKDNHTLPKTKNILSYSAAIATGVVTAPLAEEYHFVLFLPLVIGLLKHFIELRFTKARVNISEFLFWFSLLLMLIPPKYYNSLQYANAPLVFLAYPKLYAGIIFLTCYISLVRKDKFIQHS